MPPDTPEVQLSRDAVPSAKRGGKTRAGKLRLLSLSDLDSRTAAYRDATALVEAIVRECGGDRIPIARQKAIEAAAFTTIMRRDLAVRWIAGEPIDYAAWGTLCNVERRQYEAAEAFHIAPRDVTPSVAQYVASLAGEGKAAP